MTSLNDNFLFDTGIFVDQSLPAFINQPSYQPEEEHPEFTLQENKNESLFEQKEDIMCIREVKPELNVYEQAILDT